MGGHLRSARRSASIMEWATGSNLHEGSESNSLLVDMLSTVVGRINLNAQCSRGPDSFPFSGRRSSAMGTMSVSEAIRAFSVEVIVAFPDNHDNKTLAEGMEEETNFFQPIVKRQKSKATDMDVDDKLIGA